MQTLTQAVEASELAALHRQLGSAPHHRLELSVDSPFLDGDHQLITSAGRRAEICYVLHRGEPGDGVLLHRKTFYPDVAFRLPTGGIHTGEAVLETLVREIAEETSFHLSLPTIGRMAPQPVPVVTLQRFLGTLEYEIYHRSQSRVHRFATYHFLIAAPADADPQTVDPEEHLAGWQWRALAEMPQVADILEAVGTESPVWGDWGRFHALSHRFVAEAAREAGF